MQNSEVKAHTVGVRMPIDLYRTVQDIAVQDNRSVSNVITTIIRQHVQAQAQ